MKTKLILIVCILVGIIFLVRECKSPPIIQDPIIETVTDTVIKIKEVKVAQYIPKPYAVLKTDTLWKTQKIDTNAILVDYFSTVISNDTILNDSTAFIVVMDSISQNRIKSREIYAKVYSQAIYSTTTITQPAKLRNKIFIGIGAGGSSTSFGMDLSIMLLNKKENAYTLSYDVINKDIRFTMYWKIHF